MSAFVALSYSAIICVHVRIRLRLRLFNENAPGARQWYIIFGTPTFAVVQQRHVSIPYFTGNVHVRTIQQLLQYNRDTRNRHFLWPRSRILRLCNVRAYIYLLTSHDRSFTAILTYNRITPARKEIIVFSSTNATAFFLRVYVGRVMYVYYVTFATC